MRTCNVTAWEALAKMDPHLYHIIKLSTLCLSYTANMLLSVPLLLAISRVPSLLGKPRFLLLSHLLCCNNLQLLILLAKAAVLTSWQGMPVAQCLVFSAVHKSLSIVALLLSTALAVDRCVAIKWPLRYETLMAPSRQRAALAAAWTVSLLIGTAALYMALSHMQVNALLPRCNSLLVATCLSADPTLGVFCLVVSAVVLPVCYLTMLACLLLLCWDTQCLLCWHRRARVTLGMQAAQMLFFSVPIVLDSYLLPSEVHCDSLDLATSTIYNLGISLIPLVYGYRSRELQCRLHNQIGSSQRPSPPSRLQPATVTSISAPASDRHLHLGSNQRPSPPSRLQPATVTSISAPASDRHLHLGSIQRPSPPSRLQPATVTSISGRCCVCVS